MARVWICENNPTTVIAIRDQLNRQGLGSLADVLCSVDAALSRLDEIVEGDIVCLDSQMPASEGDKDDDPQAGLRIAAAIRNRGLRCPILWHSTAEMPVAMGGLQVYLAKTYPALAIIVKGILTDVNADKTQYEVPLSSGSLADVQRHAVWVLARLDAEGGPVDSFLRLLPLCQGFLTVAEVTVDRSPWASLARLRYEPGIVERLVDDGWFKPAIRCLSFHWSDADDVIKLPDGLERIADDLVESHRLRTFFDDDVRGYRREIVEPLRRTGESEGEEGLIAQVYKGSKSAVVKLCSALFREALHDHMGPKAVDNPVDWLGLVRRGRLGLLILATAHLDFTRDSLMKRRSLLNHTALMNGMASLFEPDRIRKTADALLGIGPAAGRQVTCETLDKWPIIRTNLLENTSRIVDDFDPLRLARNVAEMGVTGEVAEWLLPTCREDGREWLGLREWKSTVVTAITAFDDALTDASAGRVSVEFLGERVWSLVEAYSGKGFFNFD